jgi:crotonobetainyl-CoA:carnitine CoA-transferase CaiB-like acyl-CoA transferase
MVDIGLYEPIFRILDELAPAYAYKGYVRQRMGPATVNVVPHSHYPTKDGRWIAIACTSDKIYERLAAAMASAACPAPSDWLLLNNREARSPAVDEHVTAFTARHTRRTAAHLRSRPRCRAARSTRSTRSSRTRSTRARQHLTIAGRPAWASADARTWCRACPTPRAA